MARLDLCQPRLKMSTIMKNGSLQAFEMAVWLPPERIRSAHSRNQPVVSKAGIAEFELP